MNRQTITNRIISSSFWALVVKEIRQILRNKALVVLLTILSVLQIILYGFALTAIFK